MTTQTIPLGDLVEIKGGGTPSRTVSEFWNGNIPWATVKDFKSTALDATEESITLEGLKRSATNIIPSGNVIIPTRMAVGKAAINSVDMAINQDLKALLPKGKIDKRFLLHFLLAKGEFLEGQAQGATVKGIKLDLLRTLPFPALRLDEQRRIAVILDKADAIRRKRQQALALADDFLKSVFLEMFGDPETNPKQLPQEELGKLLERIDSGHSPKCESRPAAEDEIGILKVSSISSTHFRPEENKAVFEGYPIDERNLVHKGDLLFSRKNTYQLVGASAIVENAHGKLALPDLIFRLVPRSDRKIELPYLWMLLTQDSIRERLRKVAGGSAASMPNIGKERLRSVLLPIAKPEDQVQFTRYYSKRISLKKKLQENLKVSEDLFASLSQLAFRGEL